MTHATDILVGRYLQENGPGAAIGIMQANRLLHYQGYGLASLEWQTPIRPDTVFRIASLTKQFTTAAILMLQMQGKLHLEDSLLTHLPECPASWQNIRIRHLLTHTSGLENVADMPGFQMRASHDLSLQEVIALFEGTPLRFEPGADFYYGNSGYHLLGLVIERLSGMSYEKFIRSAIFEPLGMKQSFFQQTTPIIPRRASGYITTANSIMPAPLLSTIATHSSGAIESTLNDLIIWERATREQTLLNAAAQDLMLTPTILSDGRQIAYGLGWAFSNYRGKAVACHGGWSTGYRSLIARFLEDDLTIIILSNHRDFAIERIALELAAQYIDFPLLTRQALSQEISSFQKILGNYNLAGAPTSSHIEITGRNQRILLRRGLRETVLFPVSETEFVPETNHDVAYRFAEERDGAFHSLTITYPLHFSIAKRQIQATLASSS